MCASKCWLEGEGHFVVMKCVCHVLYLQAIMCAIQGPFTLPKDLLAHRRTWAGRVRFKTDSGCCVGFRPDTWKTQGVSLV